MILIHSSEDDLSTSDVIDWLLYYNKEFVRFSINDTLTITVKIDDGNVSIFLKINERNEIKIKDIVSYWYRRSFFNIGSSEIKKINKETQNYNDYIQMEYNKLESFFNYNLNKINRLGNITDNSINKLIVLQKASYYGLNIPNTIITSSKKKLISFYKRCNNGIIAKAISEGLQILSEKINYGMHTVSITEKSINKYPEEFPYSLFQELIEKKYDLRIFYIDGVCYSSVIFSQNNDKTKIDFRNYDHNNPNRVCPYKLPKLIEDKINLLMNSLKLRTGSIDMIYTTDKRYIFLEVNPVGQFSQVSIPCNYNIEKIIAETLINWEK